MSLSASTHTPSRASTVFAHAAEVSSGLIAERDLLAQALEVDPAELVED
jgi:hypothetical protein